MGFFLSVIHHAPFQKYLGKQYPCPPHFHKLSLKQTVVEINDGDQDCGFHSLVFFLAPAGGLRAAPFESSLSPLEQSLELTR